ncbi:MAG: N-6 DNA methylase [Cyanobacteria bacterium]|nr:N-6 DNA methylase [Cyanobacteriota bacterium]
MGMDAIATAIANYLKALHANRATGATVAETTHYPALQTLLDAIGADLKPAVRCIVGLSNQGAGMPDGGLFVASQFAKGEALPQNPAQPERGVIEAKGVGADVRKVARSEQVKKYWLTYRQVLVTSFREFLLVGEVDDRQTVLESFSFAPTVDAFWQLAANPRSLPKETAEQFVEFIKRVMLSRAKIATPEQVAWFLASYARDARSRIEAAEVDGPLPILIKIRESFEAGLGIQFDRDRGDRFFRSTLVQTLFYGIFSAWVIWHRERDGRPSDFSWDISWRYLQVPVLQSLFHKLSDPIILETLDLVELFDRTASVLNRVVRSEFFSQFEDSKAVQYFYEPFLEAFDPVLRKEFGVWYTPPEVVRYMVERVDRVLREELGCKDGLANPDVYVLDPCCGTGAYLVAVIEKIAETLALKTDDGAIGSLEGMTDEKQSLKEIVLNRIFGFELLTAPFTIAHLQIALKLNEFGDPLSLHRQGRERVSIFLTNALTGWVQSVDVEQRSLEFMTAFEQERDAADKIKQKQPILVVIGNPPYNSFAGIAVDEERELSEAYRTVQKVAKPQGQGLNDLYVRFFRMAERRIVEQTQRGIVCFISNYSWLDGLSFTGMRERYLNSFDRIYIDNLNGDKYATGKMTPDGQPDPSVFSTDWNREGIQVGTAVALLLKKREQEDSKRKFAEILYRDFWGKSKLKDLECEVKPSRVRKYLRIKPSLNLGLPFKSKSVTANYFDWPLLVEIFPLSFPGVKTSRDDGLIDIDRANLVERISKYFSEEISDQEMLAMSPTLMNDASRFNARETRNFLKSRGVIEENFILYCYRPFDLRFLYWEPETKLLDEKRKEYRELICPENIWICAAQKHRRSFDPPIISRNISSLHVIERGANIFPLKRKPITEGKIFGDKELTWNISLKTKEYCSLEKIEDLFFHVASVLYAVKYRTENSDVLKQDWPRIPLPNDRALLQQSAELGQRIAHLLDPETPIPGITSGTVEPPYRAIAIPTTTHGNTIKGDDLILSANWGNGGNGKPVMPGKGKAINRPYTSQEQELMGDNAIALLGSTTYDIHLNETTYWKNIPERVWKYTIGGYQVLKKWLSYRDQKVLGRPLKPAEVRHLLDTARRISAIILLEPDLDANYEAIKQNPYPWPK